MSPVTSPDERTESAPDRSSTRTTPEQAGLTTGTRHAVRAAATATSAAVLAATAVALIALLFLWPLRAATAKDIPLALAGPPQAVQLVERQLAAAGAPFATRSVSDREAAVTAIRERAVYGAIVVRPGARNDVEVLTASAASPVVAQALGHVAQQLQMAAPSGAAAAGVIAVRTTEVVPLADNDPRGAGIAMLALPLGIGGLIVGSLVAIRVRGAGAKTAVIVGGAALAGLAWTLILHPWFGMLTGSFWTEWGLSALAVAATGGFVAGLHAIAGVPGVAVAALITTPFGFPLAGTQVPKEFLPDPWGTIGQGLVPGATSTAFRLESYFPDASLGTPLLVLACWLVGGLALVWLGRRGATHGEPTARARRLMSASSPYRGMGRTRRAVDRAWRRKVRRRR